MAQRAVPGILVAQGFTAARGQPVETVRSRRRAAGPTGKQEGGSSKRGLKTARPGEDCPHVQELHRIREEKSSLTKS